jgi:transcription initiation factor IIE alpha subunit
MDAAGIEDAPAAAPGGNARVTAVWESWKSRLGGGCAKVIDALLLHGEMNTQQLAIACGCNRNTIPNLILKLNRAGLINKNGGRFSLKPLT